MFWHAIGYFPPRKATHPKIMKKQLFLLCALSAFWTTATAQSPAAGGAPLTLDDCMAYAVEHSHDVAQQDLANANYRQDYIESVASLVPSLGGSAGASTSFGRAADPETNTYTNTSSFNHSYGVSGSMVLFAGWSGINTMRAARVMRLMGIEELQRIRDEVALRTMEAYIDAVYYAEAARLAREQLAASTAQAEKGRRQLELGLKSAADVAELEARQASDDYLVTQQENNLELARITLAERMNWPADRPLQIDTRIRIDDPAVMDPYADVLAYALDHHPKAEVAAYEERQSRLRLAATRGRQYPSLSVGGGFSTNFFKNIEDWSLYASYADQLRDNRSHYFSAQLSVPIFGGLARRTAVNRARNNYRMAQQRRQQTLRQIESEVAQAYQQMQGTGKELVQATRKSSAAELAYRAAEAKYDRGMISTFDLQTASNNLLQARSERLRARLQYIVKTRLVEYYNGRPLIRQQ